jgi:AcrR family transcriptional regulator
MGLSERQKEIIEASLEIIGESGIQALTIRNISKKVGISEPAIYRHFDNKTQILLTILEFFIVNNNQIISYETAKGKKVEDIIEMMFTNFVRTFTQHPHLISVVFSEEIFRNDDVFKEKSSAIINENLDMLKQIIIRGQMQKEVKPELNPEHIAVILMGSLRLFVKRWQMSDFSFNFQEEGKKLQETFLKLIIKD